MSKAALNTEPRELAANALMDYLLTAHKLKNDAALARALKVAPPVISKVRNNRLPVGDSLRLKIMRQLGTPLAKLDELAPVAA